MLPRMRVAVLVAVVAVAIAGGHARAAAPTAADKQARELFQKAEMSFNLGKFAEALDGYQAAYKAKPLPAFLFNIAQCYRNLENYEKARFFYRRYLALDPRTPNRRLVEDLIAEMTKMAEKHDAAKADAKAAEAESKAKPVDVATAKPPGGDSTKPADPSTKPAETAPPPPPPPVVIAPPPPRPPPVASVELTAPSPKPEAPPPVYQRWWFWAGIGAVVVGAVAITWAVTRDTTPSGSLGTLDGR